MIIFLEYRSLDVGLSCSRQNTILNSLSSSTTIGSLLVTIYAIYSLAILEGLTILYALIALGATFITFTTLHDLSKDEVNFSSPTQLEQILTHLSLRVVLFLAAALVLQTVLYGYVVLTITPIVEKTVIKAVFWTSLCKMVSLR